MIRIILFFVLWFQLSSGEEFDPRNFDYCSKKCTSPDTKHTACDCPTIGRPPREVLVDDFMHFRTRMVDLHNGFRNELAKGRETKKHRFPQAANMHVINYDLELEFIANCYAKSISKEHDKCRMKHDMDSYAGQNIYGFSEKVKSEDYDSFFNRTVECWYEEIQNVTDASIVDKFRKDDSVKSSAKAQIGHFTQVVWASVRAIGCARVFIDKNPERPTWRTILLCNYAGRQDEGFSGNMRDYPIYKKGTPCSQCPNGEKCNTEYGGKWDALCGESEAIPARVPYGFEGRVSSEGESAIPSSQMTDSKISSTQVPNATTGDVTSASTKLVSDSEMPDFTSSSTKGPDSNTPNSKCNGAHQIFVDPIFIVGLVVSVVIISFY